MKRLIILFILFPLIACLAFSIDYGAVLEQKIEVENEYFVSDTSLTPWFSWSFNKEMSVYISGIFTLQYEKYSGDIESDTTTFIPELSYTAFKYQIKDDMSIEAGRIDYSDNIGFTAAGLFDGARFTWEMLPSGKLTANLFYTGLLYKETAKIIMSDEDKIKYSEPWGQDNPEAYFASRRLLMAGRWDMRLLEKIDLSGELIMQFDVNSNNDKLLHSQYVQTQAEYYLNSMMRLSGGLLAQIMQNNEGDFGAAFGALAKLRMALPTSMNDWLGFTVKFTSASSEKFTSYIPLSSIPQGEVFQETLAGLLSISADYSVRIIRSLYAEATMSYYIKTYEATDGNYFYGGELWAYIAWQPFEDIRGTLGAGLFLPSLGNAYPSDTGVMYKIAAGIIMSF
jgi:hypothetical protein